MMKSPIRFIVLICLISTFGLLASDIYVPAMPVMAKYFGVPAWEVQQTIAIYLIVLAFSQVIYGPLSDNIGRRMILIIGSTIYIVGSIVCAFTPSFSGFIAGRCIQALGAASGLVIGRALISDRFSKFESAKIYNIVYPLVSLSPALAPALGGYLTSIGNWRWCFLFVAFFGSMPLFMAISMLKETKKSDSKQWVFLSGFGDVLRNRTFVLYSIVVCSIYSAWFVYLTQSSFIFHSFGLSESKAGWLYIPLTCGIFVGNLISKRLLAKVGYDNIVMLGVLCFLTGGGVFMLTTFFNMNSVALVIAPMVIVSLSNGSSLPLAVSGAVSCNPERAATASGLIGFFQIGSASLATAIVSKVLGTSHLVLSISIIFFSLIAFFAANSLRRNYSQIIQPQGSN